ncbi:MAG: hypothetical protein P4L61_01310 [Candidatus Pacebacteria bacterium]|nr:hypothetical protein [Candidatus Paceibacterota bacterium]
MFHFSAFMASVGMFFSGIFGGGQASATAMNHPGSNANAPWTASTTAPRGGMMPMMRNGVFGLVETISGTTITVDGHQGTSTATTTYSVDASNAKIIKGASTSTASITDISVGDRVAVFGTVNSDDSIVATTIMDGRITGMMGGRGMASSTTSGRWNNGASSTPGMRHPTPGTPIKGYNPGGPMIPAGAQVNGQLNGQVNVPGASVNANVGADAGSDR